MSDQGSAWTDLYGSIVTPVARRWQNRKRALTVDGPAIPHDPRNRVPSRTRLFGQNLRVANVLMQGQPVRTRCGRIGLPGLISLCQLRRLQDLCQREGQWREQEIFRQMADLTETLGSGSALNSLGRVCGGRKF
jgi:hypothetical protein